jgi:hypothetical protein
MACCSKYLRNGIIDRRLGSCHGIPLLLSLPPSLTPIKPNKALAMLDNHCIPPLDPKPLPFYIAFNVLLTGNSLVIAQLG